MYIASILNLRKLFWQNVYSFRDLDFSVLLIGPLVHLIYRESTGLTWPVVAASFHRVVTSVSDRCISIRLVLVVASN